MMLDMADRAANAERYCNSVRSPLKRRHAYAVDRAMRHGYTIPGRPEGLSVMGAQAVEMRLRAIYRGESDA